MIAKRRKKKTSETKLHRVYCTYFPDKRYYIGYSCKSEKLFEKYYGSSTLVKEHTGELEKEVISVYKNKNEAKIQEFLLQWQCRHDDLCLNDMIHLRLRLKYLSDTHQTKTQILIRVYSYCLGAETFLRYLR